MTFKEWFDDMQERYQAYYGGYEELLQEAFEAGAKQERERLVLEVEGLLTEPEDDWDGGYWNQAIERAVLKIEKGEA